jgi:23S rRNA U2552 (ribose-2'-O)-methylase RlmE/FtsJ
MYFPTVFRLESGKSDILDKEPNKDNLVTSSTINLPLSSLGFHAFIHRTKNAMSITKKLETKNKFYYVVNDFEPMVSNYEDSLKELTNVYLGIKDAKMGVESRGFYKMWEMLYFFGLAEKKDMTYASIAQNSNVFMQAIINYREKLGQGIANDKMFSVKLNSEKGKYLEFAEQLLGHYNKTYPELINIHEPTVVKKTKKMTSKNNIEQMETIKSFKKEIEKSKNYADLITADGSLVWDDKLFQEQEGYQLILAEIIAALKVQAKHGNFVLKVFETFTYPSIKLIYILSSFYEETYLYKPYLSRPSTSEKYVVCKGFKFDQTKDNSILNKKIKTLESVLEGMNTMKFVFDIFPGLELPYEYIEKYKFINVKLTNAQQIMINDIVVYINENNYFGDKYHKYREKQINATKWWVSNFYPPSNNLFLKNKEDLHKLFKASQEKYHAEFVKFSSSLVK